MTDDNQGKVPSDVQHAASEGSPEGQQDSGIPTENKPTDSLPEETSERTKEQFEKLLKSNKELAEKLKKLEGEEKKKSVYDSLRPEETTNSTPSASSYSNLDQKQVEQVRDELIDQDGYLNPEKLRSTLNEANERAKKAEERARSAEERFQRYEETQQLRDAYKEFPQLDPYNEGYDANFYRLVRNELTSQYMKGEKDLVKACKDISKIYNPKSNSTEKEAEKKKVVEKKEAQIDQINAATPKPSIDFADLSSDDLRKRTIRGDETALDERLRRAGL